MQGMAGRIAQITNISPQATPEQIKTMFQFLGVVEESMLYPIMDDPSNPITKVGFVKYEDSSSVNVAQHLTNTVFIDRALIVVPYDGEKIPDEMIAMHLPATVSVGGVQQPTVLPNVDPAKLDEIQRTVYVGNLDSKNATAEQLMAFFGGCGEVRYVRMAGDETQPTRFAFVEFGSSVGVQKAIMMNGLIFGDRPIKIEKCRRGLQIRNDEILNRCANVDVYRINHSNNAIVKPPMTGGGKVVGGADAREIDEAMRRVREAQSLIAKALEPEKAVTAKKRSRSRSRSRHRRHRSRSRDRSSRRRRSRSRSHGRSRSRRSRSRSRDRRRSRRSRSKSKDRRRSKRSRSRSRKKKSKSKSPKKSRSKSPSKKTSSSKSSKSAKDKDRKSDRDRDRDKKRSDRKKDRSEDENESKSKKKRKSSESGDEKKAQNGNHQEGEAIPVIKTDA